MIKSIQPLLILIQICFLTSTLAQPLENGEVEIFSNSNRKLFAEYLYCQKDYLRAISEYREFLKHENNDTVKLKIGLALREMGRTGEALDNFKGLFFGSHFSDESRLEFMKTLFLSGQYSTLSGYNNIEIYRSAVYQNSVNKMLGAAALLNEAVIIDSSKFFEPFSEDEKNEIGKFYLAKTAPAIKSELTAGLLSAAIPGLGKIYTDEIGDGITSLLFTGVLGFLAYDNFKNKHDVRAWIFTGLAAYFYAGNIYGSIAAAQNYNAGVRFNFENEFKIFLGQKNYFCPDINFNCR